MRRLGLLLCLFAASGPPLHAADPDAERATWKERRGVTLAAPGSASPGFASIALPPEVAARSKPDLSDLRLVDDGGVEVPYVIDRHVERTVIPTWSGRLVDTQREKKVRSVWVVDLGEKAGFDQLVLEVREQDFAKRLKVEVSLDRQSWRLVREDAGIFDRPWTVRVHHTSILLAERVDARYVRLSADDVRTRPIDVVGLVASDTRRIPGSQWSRAVGLAPAHSSRPGTHYHLDLPEGLPFETFHLDAEDPAFCRKVVLLEVRERNGKTEESVIGEKVLYRLRLEDELLSGDDLDISVGPRQGGALLLEVLDGDSPPLRKPRAVVSSPATRLLFPVVSGALTLYYGNDATRAPVYDIESLKWRLGLSTSFVPAALGPEVENPRFQKAPPLAFTAARGASLQTPRWRVRRAIDIAGAEDLYTLTLDAEDMGFVEPDLRDIRIVDAQDQQVPCTVEPGASEKRVTLAVSREPSPKGKETTSRYRLSTSARLSANPQALPLSTLEITFKEAFFSREARVLAVLPPGTPTRERMLVQALLQRTPDRTAPPTQDPLLLGLDRNLRSELFLEIDEGDNAPLSIAQVQATVHVPRVAFKAGPGKYRLLLGNAEAQAPRYDIATLRREILAYSAVPIGAAAAEANPSFRRSAGDYFRQAPPTAILWGTLVGAVVGLVFLTVRILKQPPTGGD